MEIKDIGMQIRSAESKFNTRKTEKTFTLKDTSPFLIATMNYGREQQNLLILTLSTMRLVMISGHWLTMTRT